VGTITGLTVSEAEGEALVTIYGGQPLVYTAVKHQFPVGVSLYFRDTSLEGLEEVYAPESTVVKIIETSELDRERPSSRIEIRLHEDFPYEVTRAENDLLVRFKKPVEAPSAAQVPRQPEEAPLKAAEEVKPEAEALVAQEAVSEQLAEPEEEPALDLPVEAAQPPEPVGEIAAAPEKGKEGPALVNRIDFEMMEGGKSKVVVGATKEIRVEAEKTSEKRLLLKLHNARIPEFQKRPLITARFKSAVDRILPMQSPKMGDTAAIAVELREAVPYRIEEKGETFMVEFEASVVPPRPTLEAEEPAWKEAMKAVELAVVEKSEEPSKEPVVTETGKRYTGEKISLNFQDADIHSIFRILHEVSGANFVIGEDVQGRVTLKLVDVPWDQALDLILEMNKLGTVVEGNVIRIATLETLREEKKALQESLQAEQQAKEQEALVTDYISVNYSDAADIKTHIDELKTARGKVTYDERTNIIIIKDIQAVVDRAKELAERLDMVTPQVLIEARIVEANTNFSSQLGIAWSAAGGIQASDPDAGVGPQRGFDTLGGTYGYNMAVNLPPGTQNASLGFNFLRLEGSRLSLNAMLYAMETDGKGEIISNPKIITLDNKEATISQGNEVPYQTVSEEGTKTEFKEVKLLLKVTPHVTPDNRISMKIMVSKNEIGQETPDGLAVDTNEAETELLVNNGDTIVIGGILRSTRRETRRGVPGVSKVPVLSWLFRSEQVTLEKRELLIFITPTKVELERPLRVEEVTFPGKGLSS
jgi:type IV pilus assembly protein PilQ